MKRTPSALESSYDRVARHYASEYFEELSRKPFDRELLNQFAERVSARGQVCEIGCGPGQIARYLKDRGVRIIGIDLSERMVSSARELNHDISFAQGDMLALDFPDNSFTGVVSFYAIIHLKRDEVTRALKEIFRVLEPAGRLMVSFHGGEGELHRDEWYGEPVSIDVTLMTRDEMIGYLEAAGFTEAEVIEREPYEFEYPTRRMYALAGKDASGKL
jgi:ubiquinone/menaquinone biosynthesis C-methylase UbiE